VQDTLHHLEPFQEILQKFKGALKPQGKLIAIEENGNNLLIRANRYRTRGNNRIIEVYDEKLGKTHLLGNENIRSFETWKKEFEQAGFSLSDKMYIRLFFPFFFNKNNSQKLISREQALWKSNSVLREYLFMGLNFIAQVK
jgi:hypothetical protein